MLSKEVVELSKQHSIIRDIFEYGMIITVKISLERHPNQRKMEHGS